jgi:hypothetical protein
LEKIVEKEAKVFAHDFMNGVKPNTLENLKDSLEVKLFSFKKDKDRLFFLNVLRKDVEKEILEHEKKCTSKSCHLRDEYEIAFFVIDQEIEDISEYYSFKPKQQDEFSTEEKVNFHNKLNEIANQLEKLGYGQEIIFEEIDSLNENFQFNF